MHKNSVFSSSEDLMIIKNIAFLFIFTMYIITLFFTNYYQ